MDNSPFTRLPPELRNLIWEYVFQQDGPIVLRDSKTPISRAPRRNVYLEPEKSLRISLDDLQASRRFLTREEWHESPTDAVKRRRQGISKTIHQPLPPGWQAALNNQDRFARPKEASKRLITRDTGWDPPRHILALTKTCKELHEECTKLFYNTNTFRFRSVYADKPYPRGYPTVQKFRKQIGEENFSAMSKFEITVHNFRPEPFFDERGLYDLLRITKMCAGQKLTVKLDFPQGSHTPRVKPRAFVVHMRDVEGSWQKIMEELPREVTRDIGDEVKRRYRENRAKFEEEVGRLLESLRRLE